jgi:3'-5' exoribonuclease
MTPTHYVTTPEEAYTWLSHAIGRVEDTVLRNGCYEVINDARFYGFPASTGKHHSGSGGLMLHTAQVAQIALNTAIMASLNQDVVLVAAIWHDQGKIFDYERVPDQTGNPSAAPEWRYTEHHSMIRHVVRSFSNFVLSVEPQTVWAHHLGAPPTAEQVANRAAIEHCILAHHGRKEWGSPVEPQTPEAWALHLADLTSVLCVDKGKTG